jgi:hypothetical protein
MGLQPGQPAIALYAEPSWAGLFRRAVRLPGIIRASFRGYFSGRVDGNLAQLPADFLIDEALTVREADYGKDVGDHLATDDIERWLRQRQYA